MAAKLGELLIQNELITEEQLDQALQAQLVFGGRLGTNLVELGMITTTRLAEFLSRQLGVGAMSPSQLELVSDEAKAAITPEMADRYQVVPLQLEKRTLHIAMGDPTDLDAVDAIRFRTGLRVVPVVAPELLVMFALEKFYGVTRPNRYIRVSEALLRTDAATPAGAEEADFAPAAMESARTERFVMPGPYGLREACPDLVAAERHTQVLEVLRAVLHDAFERVVVVALDERHGRIWGQVGCPIPPERAQGGGSDPLRGLEIPIGRSLVLQAATRVRHADLQHASLTGEDDLLQRLLDPGAEPILVVTIRPGKNAVAAALATGAHAPESLDDLAPFQLLASKCSDALELVRLKSRILAQ